MKHIVFISLIACLCMLSCKETNLPTTTIPDFSNCQCMGVHRDVVCGADGRTYLDSCLAECLGVTILQAGNCPDAWNDPSDTLNWEVVFVCNPIGEFPKAIQTLADGSVLYQDENGDYFRGTANYCICLPPTSKIGTPAGSIPIASLQKGDIVWTTNHEGQKVAQPIEVIRSVSVKPDHQLLQLVLDDGRTLAVSPMHPNAKGVALYELNIGDCLDESMIIEKRLIEFEGNKTWDLLPAGGTGLYYADDILIQSTLPISNPLL